jgi:hypothetical protein
MLPVAFDSVVTAAASTVAFADVAEDLLISFFI